MSVIKNNYNFKQYISFWCGQLSSLLGSIVVQFIIIWWITTETQSVLILSLSSLFYFLPQIIFTPIAGVLVDKWNRKRWSTWRDYSHPNNVFHLCFSRFGAIGFLLLYLTFNAKKKRYHHSSY